MNKEEPKVLSHEWQIKVNQARALCPKCSKRGMGYANHPHAFVYKDYGRLSCRYCRSRFKFPTLKTQP